MSFPDNQKYFILQKINSSKDIKNSTRAAILFPISTLISLNALLNIEFLLNLTFNALNIS